MSLMSKNALLGKIISQQGVSPDPSTNRYDSTEDRERAAIIPWYTKPPKFSTVAAEVCKSLCKLTLESRLDMEQDIRRSLYKSKNNSQMCV